MWIVPGAVFVAGHTGLDLLNDILTGAISHSFHLGRCVDPAGRARTFHSTRSGHRGGHKSQPSESRSHGESQSAVLRGVLSAKCLLERKGYINMHNNNNIYNVGIGTRQITVVSNFDEQQVHSQLAHSLAVVSGWQEFNSCGVVVFNEGLHHVMRNQTPVS